VGAVSFIFAPDKNLWLKEHRGISFEEVISLIDSGHLLDVIEHKNHLRYGHQKVYVVDVSGYIYLVPFVKDGDAIFLKTIYPSRKATKEYARSDP
jgi:hypothetical protein